MEFLYFLEGLRNPVFDFIFSLITHLGEETFFLVAAIFVFWCVDKRGGYYILTTGLIGTVINQWLKLIFRIDRPWVLDTEFEPVGDAIEEATGYSFPSGHTQNIAGTFGSIFAYFKKNWLRITSVVIIILVAFSRNYLGVHTPLDVVVSLGVALVLVVTLYPIFSDEERFNKLMPYVIGGCFLLSLGFLIYVNCLNPADFTGEGELDNLTSGLKNGSTLFGCMLGLLVVYPVDSLITKFDTKANWYSQIIKLALGLGIILVIKALQSPIEAVVGIFTPTPTYIARAIRYFLIVVFAGAVWPLTFKFFGNLKIGFMEKFTEWITSRFKKIQHAPTPTDTPEA